MKNTVRFEITYNQFENVLVTALEGGSNYWYMLDLQKIKDKPRGEPWSQFLARKCWNEGFKLPVFDREEGGLLGYFTKAKFLRNASKEPWALAELIDETYDANTADVLFQLGTMGEVTFG